ncbi:MAG TPA: L,D-transpeptidase, partial [Solirubrobacteraceae bacterium]|nr:L,D-transpeptidase [Solirubrobacteraceae bacterium]
GLVRDPSALAKINMPLGGAKVQSVVAVTGPHSQRVPVVLHGSRIWPQGRIRAGETISIQVVIRRPGWISWLTGAQQRLQLTVQTPVARVAHSYLTLKARAPLEVRFSRPVSAIAYGPTANRVVRHALPAPTSVVTLDRTAVAGSIWISGVPLAWETGRPQVVSWFPAGAATSAVATPAPGTTIHPHTPIALTFSKPVRAALGRSRPPVIPATQGSWQQVGSHTIVFKPQGYGYGLGASVRVALPAGVRVVGATGRAATWTVPQGSPLRLQQLLANLGYLPLNFNGSSVPATMQAQEYAAIHPPSGSFTWRYGNVPSSLRSDWAPGASGTMTEGAVMAFENDHGLATVGLSNPLLWRYLIRAAVSHQASTFGYTYVMVTEGSPESLTLWHNGRTLFTVPVNTGIPQAPTAQGTFPVYEHLRVTTMSGTNPDGSHYSDPGIPYVSYFNGGDALHGFLRAQYGFPQSLGCVEMNYGDAARVWPYTPIGTLVNVT